MKKRDLIELKQENEQTEDYELGVFVQYEDLIHVEIGESQED